MTETKRFIMLLNEIIKAIHRLQESIQQQTSPPSANNHQKTKHNDVQPPWLQPVLSAYKESMGKNQVNDERQYKVQRSIRNATWAAFGAVVVYALVTLGILRANKEAADAARDAAKAAQDEAVLAWRQLEGTMAAEVHLSTEIVQSPCCELQVAADNAGHRTAEDVTIHLVVTFQRLPSKETIGNPYHLSIGPRPLRPAMEEPDPISKQYSFPNLTQEFIEAATALRETVRVEGSWTYDNGFGRIISQPRCGSFLIGPWRSGDATRNTPPYPYSAGFWDCSVFDGQMREVRRTKRLTEEEWKKQRQK